MKLKKLGEFGLIKRITRPVKDKNVLVGIGDDAAVIKTSGLQVLTTDTLVEGDHFTKEWFTPKQIGMKAIEINVSDVASMGAIPKYALVSLILPINEEVEYIEAIYKGMRHSCKKYQTEIIGGNITHGDKLSISITLIGEVKKENLCLRSGAKPGDFIFVTGYLGNGRAGLRLFQKGLRNFLNIKKHYLEPKAKLKESLKNAPYCNAMQDILDGLASEIKHICEQSKVGAVIYKENIPILEDVREVAARFNESEYDYALYGGEDFELVFTCEEKNLQHIAGLLVGEITKKKGIRLYENGKEHPLTKEGYDHFSNPI